MRWIVLFFLCLSLIAKADTRPPNFIIVFVDDMGWSDLHCFGAEDIQTPNLDRMASEGLRLHDFYVGQPICSASRAALMTGCYPNRVGILGALSPLAKIGISDHEMIIPQMLKQKNYATAIVGKWHLGRPTQFLPLHHGFDEYFGIPYSHDMFGGRNGVPPIPLMEGDKIIETNPDKNQLTTRYTERAVDFIHRSKDKPFFLYLAHNLPHVPIGVSDKFRGKSHRGLYGDVIMEIDWSVGQVLGALKADGIDNNTFVMFASDNGPWLLYGNHAGRALPLREGKMTMFDGGNHTDCIMRFPGVIQPGRVSHEIFASMDVLPTIAHLAGCQLSKNKIDGLDQTEFLKGGPDARSARDTYFCYWNQQLQGVRHGKWKLHVDHDYLHISVPGKDGKRGKEETLRIKQSLFDLETDIGEQHDVSAEHPEIVKELQALMDTCRDDLGDKLTNHKGKNIREPGRVENVQLDSPEVMKTWYSEGD